MAAADAPRVISLAHITASAPPPDAARLISLAHITASALPLPKAPRMAHPGGRIRTNKDEALAAFLRKKRDRGEALSEEQLTLLRRFGGDALAASAAAPTGSSAPPGAAAGAPRAPGAAPEARGAGAGVASRAGSGAAASSTLLNALLDSSLDDLAAKRRALVAPPRPQARGDTAGVAGAAPAKRGRRR